MKTVHFSMLLTAMIFLSSGCRDKETETPPRQVFLDVPFELTSAQNCYLVDVFYDSLSNDSIKNRISLQLQSIDDYRSIGIECRSSTGGYAQIITSVTVNDSISNNCIKPMPGCTGDEWDTINTFAPRCTIDVYKLYLLKLYPVDERPSNIESYIVKYVFKKL